ncbi:hypothetical protein GM415_06285 [Pseudodesulfovibrio cashew]|uniref:Uncharacterized protein n=1 Tax=Pseudodesulfovibrio cashew TaxID=2678688 RepID=A0A6I6JHA6_9BACT|nr:hypothetical protein [Pseudodesulfovibrio cashew]QGY39742.1 hypothetical protein GM415_06285 [Pseudodesulfovibrio cashew]
MKKHIIATVVLVCALAAGLLLAGCPSEPSPEAREKRLAAMEAELAALKDEAKARDVEIKKELGLLRENLDSIRDILSVEQQRSELMDQNRTMGQSLDELNDKAKTLARESMDRLMELTKELLDKLEKKMDEQTTKPAPAPEGREI